MKIRDFLERLADRLVGQDAVDRRLQRDLAELRLELARTALTQDERSVIIAFYSRDYVPTRELTLSQVVAASHLGPDGARAACAALSRRKLLVLTETVRPEDSSYRIESAVFEAYLQEAPMTAHPGYRASR